LIPAPTDEPFELISYYDFLDDRESDDPNCDLQIFVFGLRHVLETLLSRGYSSFNLWTDNCCYQFHGRKALHSVLITLLDDLIAKHAAGKSLMAFIWNFFSPYHGKCVCNSHFAYLKTSLVRECKTSGGFNAKEHLLKNTKEDGRHIIVEVRSDLPKIVDVCKVPAIKKYHCFERVLGQPSLIRMYKFSIDLDTKSDISGPDSAPIWVEHAFSLQSVFVPHKSRKGKTVRDTDDEEPEEKIGGNSWLSSMTSRIDDLQKSFSLSDFFFGEPQIFLTNSTRKALSIDGSLMNGKRSGGAESRK